MFNFEAFKKGPVMDFWFWTWNMQLILPGKRRDAWRPSCIALAELLMFFLKFSSFDLQIPWRAFYWMYLGTFHQPSSQMVRQSIGTAALPFYGSAVKILLSRDLA